MSEKRKQGELEAEILECLWSKPKGCSSQQILSLLGPSLKLTTVLTVLTRLEDKDLVEKKPGAGRSYVFYAKTSREQYIASQLLGILKKSSAGVFDHLAAGLSSKQVAQLKKALGD